MTTQNTPLVKGSRPTPVLSSLFWALLAIFISILGFMTVSYFILAIREYGKFVFPAILSIFLFLSVALLVIAIREKVEKTFKIFLILTGASALGTAVGVLLENFLTGTVGEGMFFILGVIIAPIGFLAGIIGSMVCFTKRST